MYEISLSTNYQEYNTKSIILLVNKKGTKIKFAQFSYLLLIMELKHESDYIINYPSFETPVSSKKFEVCKGSPYRKW